MHAANAFDLGRFHYQSYQHINSKLIHCSYIAAIALLAPGLNLKLKLCMP